MTFLEALVSVVRTHGDRCALEGAGRTLTYSELLRAARRLATTLEARGVRPGDHVALQLPRTPDFVVAVLAVWWLGAAWVPLAADWPARRREHVLRELDPRVVLTDVQYTDPPHERAAPITSADLAYVIYTSGSTGRPKGVRVSHAGLVPVLEAQIAAFGLAPGARVLQVLSHTFDASISDLGTALLSGATLVIHPGPLSSAAVLAALPGITHVDLPPALLARIDPMELPRSLACVVVGGELCAREALLAWAERVRVVVVYGPTEATICTSLAAVVPGWRGTEIGTPIAGFAYELDGDELIVRGPGLALGYVATSSARFFEDERGRGYRTGDRVRQTERGFAFLGRIDRQVKVRGVLVAPEEIETTLLEHPQVRRVLAQKRGERLVAFVETDASMERLRDHVQARLPRALWPLLVPVSHWHEHASGKIDEPVQSAPISAAERALAEVWRAALGGPGYRESTFDGDSFAALELVAAAEARGLPLTSEALYRGLTLAELARGVPAGEPCAATMLRADAGVPPVLQLGDGRGPILLTGATGFFGSRVLAELLDRGHEVVCLVRGAGRRVDPRARVVVGDAARPRLGLDETTWAQLAEEIAAIHHVAASVNLVLPYEQLRGANLEATRHVLELAATGRPKQVYYASTLSVGACVTPVPATFDEDDELDAEHVHGGYAASKWAAEVLVRRAAHTRTVRLGLLTGDSRTGVGSPTCQLVAFLRGLRALGVPRIAHGEALRVDVTPVDYAARAFVELAALPESAGRTFHLCSAAPPSFDDLAAALPEVPRVSLAELQTRLRDAALDPSLATTALAACRRLLGTGARHVMSDLFLASDVRFGTARTRALGFECPSVDLRLYAAEAR